MSRDVLGFPEIDRTHLPLVGGKGAHLAELSRLDGVRVPPGFCVTTEAFRRVLAEAPSLDERLARLSRLKSDERDTIHALSAQLRGVIEALPFPDALAAELTATYARLGEDVPVAVRSSATAEDLPTASFAGQQDTSLNVVGPQAVLQHVRRCWASLFTERAVTYRLKNGFDQRKVRMAVVVQRMVFPESAGILFTADPITSNRKLVSIEASFGLGEALVSGLVNADVFTVRDGAILTRTIGTKQLAIEAAATGGTRQQPIAPERQLQPALTDEQVLELARLGRRVEAHFGAPQDLEWCLAGGAFHLVQSRPITTLFPTPPVSDGQNHVWLSVGHQQMMTDALTPLGLSVWQLVAARPMDEAGGRLWVDVTAALASPAGRAGLFAMAGRSDPLVRDALQTLLDRGDFLRPLPTAAPAGPPPRSPPAPLPTDPALVQELMARGQTALDALKRELEGKTGAPLLEAIANDLQELKRLMFDPTSIQMIMAGTEATWWLNDTLATWLSEKNAADTLAQSAPNNVTSQMGLSLLDVADAIRPHPEVVAFLERSPGDDFLEVLPTLPGGQQARDAIVGWLDRYGMRCAGEIDPIRPRWSERPSTLVPVLLGNVRGFEPGAAARRFAQGLEEASKKEADVLKRLRALPDGEQKAAEAKRMIDRLRTFVGYREFPKYAWICRYFVYKQALLAEAERLVQAGVLREKEDAFFLRFQELQEVVRSQRVDEALLRERRDAYRWFQTLTPPRVLTSDGECLSGSFRREDVPAGALAGLAVSAGVVEGRARVILELADATLEPGDILVTRFTDPSWTPLFVSVAGLVTEVGGLMTHGAVIAREYGLPAVVGVDHATKRIRDGQRIRVHGTEGTVELLTAVASPASRAQ